MHIRIVFLSIMLVLAGTLKSSGQTLFDADWKFTETEAETTEASSPEYNDANWRTVSLPHDFSIERNNHSDSLHIGPFLKGIKDSISTGNIPGGTGWYRKHFTLDKKSEGKRVTIHFDGVSERSDVWINGHHLGFHPNGYMPFSYDLTPFLQPVGQDNVLAVRAFNPGDNSRWYPGSGIYRHVYLSITEKVYIPEGGIRIETTMAGTENRKAKVLLPTPVCNETNKKVKVKLHLDIYHPDGKLQQSREYENIIAGNHTDTIQMACEIDRPVLWSPDSPELYKAILRITTDGKIFDEYQSTFGIRTLDFTAEKGLLLNGKTILLKGACIHHDNGLLGAATFDKAEFRKVRLLKENGFNAIRTSHNPPSRQFLDACDQLGMLVIDEAFDMWEHPKRDQDYHLYFRKHAEKDIRALVRRDRNHPSIIMWSIGNEIYERADQRGLEIASMLINAVKSEDTTRPVTQAICGFWEHKGRDWDASAPAYALLDIGGYNYEWKQYERDHQLYPSRIMAGTESFPMEALQNWQQASSHPYVIGDFVWTGMDYIGEVGIGNFIYSDKEVPYATPTRSWPWFLSNCGDIDITGNKKPQSLYRDVVWGRSDLEILVHTPIPEGKKELISKWGWPDEAPHWNWTGLEKKILSVNVYSRCDSVHLELNGKTIGTQPVSTDNLTATFQVPYSPGILRATGIKAGKETTEKVLQTTGQAHHIELIPEEKTVSANSNDLAYVQIKIVDEKGDLVPDATVKLRLSVEGNGQLLASGNAAPDDMESFRNPVCTTWQGRCLAILQPDTATGGSMRLVVSAENLPAAITEIRIEKANQMKKP